MYSYNIKFVLDSVRRNCGASFQSNVHGEWHSYFGVPEAYIYYHCVLNIYYHCVPLHVYNFFLNFIRHFQSPEHGSRSWKSHFGKLHWLLLFGMFWLPSYWPKTPQAFESVKCLSWKTILIEIKYLLLSIFFSTFSFIKLNSKF